MKLQKGIFAGTNLKEITHLKDLPKLPVLDLGAGDGRVVKFFRDNGFNVKGIEFEAEFFPNELLFQGDFFSEDFSNYGILYYFSKGCYHQAELFKKVKKEFEGFFVVNFEYDRQREIDSWCSGLELFSKDKRIYIFRLTKFKN